MDRAGNTEATKSAPFQIGSSSGPVSTLAAIGLTGANGWYVEPATVTLTSTDPEGRPVTISYRVDGGSWTTYTAPFTLGDGDHAVEHYATNDLGLQEPTKTGSVKVDSTPPATSHSLSGTLSGTEYVGPVDVTLTASDATSGVASTRYRLDGGSWTTYAGSPVHVTASGPHAVEYDSTDAAGNAEPTKSASFAIRSAGLPPVSTLSLGGTQAESGWYTSNVTVSLSAAGTGAVTIRVRLDAADWTDYAGPITVQEGRHALGYYSVDEGGVQEAVRIVSIDVDTTPPEFASVKPTGIVVQPTVSIEWAAVDTTSGVARYDLSVNGGPFVPVNGTSLVLVLPDGTHYIALKATDEAGNSEVRAVTFRVDTAPLSPTGPYSGIPLFLLLELFATMTVLGLLARRRRVRLRRYREFNEQVADDVEADPEDPRPSRASRDTRRTRRY